jgi:feruloyl esterase
MKTPKWSARWERCLLPVSAGVVASALIHMPAQAQVQMCESLADVSLPGNTTITTAQTLSGTLSLTAVGTTYNLTGLPAFCRVNGVTKPGHNSDVNWEVWMPASSWNGRFEQLGGGGIDGSINLTKLGDLIQQGYAVAATDGGSTGQFADFVNNSDRQLDFAYRAFPATRNNAVALIQAYYGTEPTKSYFIGCSEGGREALLMAQRYPTYFDGIQAGSPAKYPSHMWIGNNIWLDQLFSNPANALTLTQIDLIQSTSTAACAAPGTGVVADPRKCSWDVSTLLCTGSNTPDSGTCLSAPQVATMKLVLGRYGGAHNPRTGEMIFPGVNPFSGLDGLFPGSNSTDSHILYIGSLFYNDLNWPWQTYNFDSDQVALDALPMAKALNTINPDLKAFAAHGGKLIMWAGWEDPQIFVWDTVNFFDYMIHHNAANPIDRELIDINDKNPEYPYFGDGSNPDTHVNRTAHESVDPATKGDLSAASQAAYTRALKRTDRFAKLYMASGVDHCGGGPGAQSFVTNGNQGELTQALRNWVENDVAPGSIQISKQANNNATGAVQFTTLMCPYPTTLTYSGSGDLLSASSYSCVMPDLATINGP